MSTGVGKTAKSGFLICVAAAGLVAASCATSTVQSGNDNVSNLSDVAAVDDPYRIVCKSYTPAGSQRAERICMTAGQWEKKDAVSE